MIQHVDGEEGGSLVLYTLSTCIWCKMTKKLLQTLNIGYDYIDVDLLKNDERAVALETLKRYNPKCSFPSLVVEGETCIIGFDEPRIREALGR